MRILVVEDERGLADALKSGLEEEGFAVDVALDGEQGLWMASELAYDAIVLDIMLPKVNGYQVCSRLRDGGNWTPILMLTAKGGEFDEAEAFDTPAPTTTRRSGSPTWCSSRICGRWCARVA